MDVDNKEVVLAPEIPPSKAMDVEQQREDQPAHVHTSAFKSLGVLDQFLAVWIFLAMLVGILLGNFVPSTGPGLQRGEFVGVSIPIGMLELLMPPEFPMLTRRPSNWATAHDVSYPLQNQIRDSASFFPSEDAMGASGIQRRRELDNRSFLHGKLLFLDLHTPGTD